MHGREVRTGPSADRIVVKYDNAGGACYHLSLELIHGFVFDGKGRFGHPTPNQRAIQGSQCNGKGGNPLKRVGGMFEDIEVYPMKDTNRQALQKQIGAECIL